MIGTTIPFVGDKELLGTVTAQVAVRSFSDFLTANVISRNSQTLIIDTSGNIIVHPDVDKGFTRDRDTLTPRKVLDLPNSPAAMAQQLRADSKKNQIEFQFGPHKETYFAVFQPFPSSFYKPWEVMTVVPLNDFLQEPASVDAGGRIVFGTTVGLEEEASGAEVTYQIVGDDEADLKLGLISISSPIARALIGKEAGDIAEVRAPGGIKRYEIVEVRYV